MTHAQTGPAPTLTVNTATIYLSDINENPCSGQAEIGFLSRCYNTSWIYYSIDMCTPLSSGGSSSSTSTALPTSESSAAAATSHRVSDAAIVGAVVGSVCGLGIIAAVCVYFFWFRPKQRERKRELKREIEESGMRAAAGAGSAGARRKEEEDGEAYLINMRESRQQSHEMQAMPDVVEAPGDNRANEMDNDGEVPVELPGDDHYDGRWNQKPRQ